jgi:hypothetical protein
MHLDERIDCTMCQFWTMLHCEKHLTYFPNDGHRCPAFAHDPMMDDFQGIDEDDD